jgi:3-deoxy-7-phosphoheptulonate synthase
MDPMRHRNEAATVVAVGTVSFGDGSYPVIAGPCAIESESQLMAAARIVAEAGASMLRGGAYKPRTSPYSFQGLGREGLRLLHSAGQATGLPTVAEVMEPREVEIATTYLDMLQVGSRNMQNVPLLRALGETGKPVLLKRGFAATIEEWLLAAEYILDAGNSHVVLCERGIRTFETQTRNTLDISAVPVAKALGRLPVIVDPSHAAGRRDLITPLALAGRAVGADGMMVEVHPSPDTALSDGPQQLDADQFTSLMDVLDIHSRREEIDRIDHRIVHLLARRVEASIEIGRAKTARGLPLLSPSREETILDVVGDEAARAGLDPRVVRAMYESILSESRRAQQRSTLAAVQGGIGA